MNVVLLDLTGGAKTKKGESLSPKSLSFLAETYTRYLNAVAGEWGGQGTVSVRAGKDEGDIEPREVALVIGADLPSDPPWLKDTSGQLLMGRSVLLDAISLADTLWGPTNAMSLAQSRMLAEHYLDPSALHWVGLSHPVATADELIAADICAPVMSETLELIDASGTTKVHCCNFVLRSWFSYSETPRAQTFLERFGSSTKLHDVPQAAREGGWVLRWNWRANSFAMEWGGQSDGGPRPRAIELCHWSSRLVRRMCDRGTGLSDARSLAKLFCGLS